LLLQLFYAAEEAGSAEDATLAAAAREADDDTDSESEMSSLAALVNALRAVLVDATLDGQYKVCVVDTTCAPGVYVGKTVFLHCLS
jgi:hypothetical protein